MFHKFFDSEKEKEKKREMEISRAPPPLPPPINNNDAQNNDSDSDSNSDNEKDNSNEIYNINKFEIDKSNRIIFYKNTLIRSNYLNGKEYLVQKELGKGAFSNVYLAYAKRKKQSEFEKKYVLKITKCKPIYTNQAVKEYQYYKKLDNKCQYVVHFKDFFSIPNNTNLNTPCLVLEY